MTEKQSKDLYIAYILINEWSAYQINCAWIQLRIKIYNFKWNSGSKLYKSHC